MIRTDLKNPAPSLPAPLCTLLFVHGSRRRLGFGIFEIGSRRRLKNPAPSLPAPSCTSCTAFSPHAGRRRPEIGNSNIASQCSGFSLLEAILAIGVLSIVVVQIVNVQSASMEIAAVSRTNQAATWALRSATAQLQYVLDVYGVEGLRPTQEFKAGPEKEFTVVVRTEETSIEASRLLVTALRMASAFGGQGLPQEDKSEAENQYKEIGQMLDSQIPKDIYRTVKVSVSWNLAGNTREIDGGFLVVDDKALTIGSDIPGLGGGEGNPGSPGNEGGGNESGGAGGDNSGGDNGGGDSSGGSDSSPGDGGDE